MTYVRIGEGLGNQLFQYAFARSISLNQNVEVRLDTISKFKTDFYKRIYSLRHFNIALEPASEEEVKKLNASTSLYDKVMRKINPNVIMQNWSRKFYDLSTFDYSKKLYFMGLWINLRYVEPIEDVLKKELQVRYPLSEKNLECAKKIENSNAVSIHFRALHGVSRDGSVREDEAKKHGKLPLSYYTESIEYLFSKLGNDLHFFIFSDDTTYAKKIMDQLNINYTLITHNDFDHDYEDLRLMSLCKHNIVANSTFSWWGAWLNKNSKKIVIAPNKKTDKSNNQNSYYPNTWVQLAYKE